MIWESLTPLTLPLPPKYKIPQKCEYISKISFLKTMIWESLTPLTPPLPHRYKIPQKCEYISKTSVWPMTLSRKNKVHILKSWVEYNALKNFHSIQLSIGVSFSFCITCFHSTTNNLTLFCSVWLHVLIVWQKTSLRCAQFQFFNPKSCYMFPIVWQKASLRCTQFQFSNPKSHYMFP